MDNFVLMFTSMNAVFWAFLAGVATANFKNSSFFTISSFVSLLMTFLTVFNIYK